MKNKIIVINADDTCLQVEDEINKELKSGWLFKTLFKVKGELLAKK